MRWGCGMTLDCGHDPSHHGAIDTGYGTDAHGKTLCYSCCAAGDVERMKSEGRITLYFANGRVTHWPGSMVFVPTYVGTNTTNGFGRRMERVDVRFNGPDGFVWAGRHQGNNNELIRCRRTKEKVKSC